MIRCDRSTYASYVDLDAAFDSHSCPTLCLLLTRLHVSDKSVWLIMTLYGEPISCVHTGGLQSSWFGDHQGCANSPRSSVCVIVQTKLVYSTDKHDWWWIQCCSILTVMLLKNVYIYLYIRCILKLQVQSIYVTINVSLQELNYLVRHSHVWAPGL